MKSLIQFLFCLCLYQMVHAQESLLIKPKNIDSLKIELNKTQNDTLRLVLLNHLRLNYFFVPATAQFDSALVYSQQLLLVAQKLNYKIDEAYALDCIGDVMSFLHNQNTLKAFFQGVKIAEDPGAEQNILPKKYLKEMIYWNDNFNSYLVENNWAPRYFRLRILASLYNDLGHSYGYIMLNEQKQNFYLGKALEIYSVQKDTVNLVFIYSIIAEYFRSTEQYDSCLYYTQKSYQLLSTGTGKKTTESYLLAVKGTLQYKKGNYQEALALLYQSAGLYDYQLGNVPVAYFTLSEYYLKTGNIDSGLYYSRKAYNDAQLFHVSTEILNAGIMLGKLYEKQGKTDSAVKYFSLSMILNDSINNADKKRKLQSQDFEEQLHQQELEKEKANLKFYTLIGGLFILLIIAFFLLRNNRQRKKVNVLLHKKNQEIESTLSELKSTQSQLIQSEKMASLGELTAGIAHEIQNPLNFVNNFSEVSRELIEELKSQKSKLKSEEQDEILNDIDNNLEKINHHGKRADAIVKGMLQHSRKNSGQKESTDINALCNEYLRLSYHGLRAKDKSFNAVLTEVGIKTDFDNTVGKINIVPQDIGRVLLNLFNNAFYAVNEKKKSYELSAMGYELLVSIQTKKLNDKIEIRVEDNGNGIPASIKEKIFQPFFTTKPTGQGTGLGLSLAYDIITKEHNGTIKVESKEGEGSTFIIQLPITVHENAAS